MNGDAARRRATRRDAVDRDESLAVHAKQRQLVAPGIGHEQAIAVEHNRALRGQVRRPGSVPARQVRAPPLELTAGTLSEHDHFVLRGVVRLDVDETAIPCLHVKLLSDQ